MKNKYIKSFEGYLSDQEEGIRIHQKHTKETDRKDMEPNKVKVNNIANPIISNTDYGETRDKNEEEINFDDKDGVASKEPNQRPDTISLYPDDYSGPILTKSQILSGKVNGI